MIARICIPLIAIATFHLTINAVLANGTQFYCPPELDIKHGNVVWEGGYSDMPYMVMLPSGKIGMSLTISDGKEGNDDQHIIWLVSSDRGSSWSKPVKIELPNGPEASWAMPFAENGRIFLFYTYNTRNIRRWPFSDKNGGRSRVDMLGDLAIRYSDDEGQTWSDRIEVSIPRTAIDMENSFAGKETIFWLTGKPVRIGEYVYIGLSKGGKSYSGNILPETEAFLFRTKKIEEPDNYELVPSGKRGFKAMNGDLVTEEPSIASFGDDSILVTMRTTSGRILQAYQSSNTNKWLTNWAKYIDGQYLEHPRAMPMISSLSNGSIILWFHNNSGVDFQNRNPVYIACAIKQGNQNVRWSKPRMLMCDSDKNVRISYPSLVEIGNGKVLISETNKRTTRVHRYSMSELCGTTNPNED